MKELLDIYNTDEISLELRIRIIQKMYLILDFQAGANIYKDIADELCDALKDRMTETQYLLSTKANKEDMTAVECLKQDIDLELKHGTKMVVNWDMYLQMEKQQRGYSEKDIDELCKLIKHNERQWYLFDNGIIKIKPKSYDEIIEQFKNKYKNYEHLFRKSKGNCN